MPEEPVALEECPVCHGTGRGAQVTITRGGMTTVVYEPCPVCRGRKMVHTIGQLKDVVKDDDL